MVTYWYIYFIQEKLNYALELSSILETKWFSDFELILMSFLRMQESH